MPATLGRPPLEIWQAAVGVLAARPINKFCGVKQFYVTWATLLLEEALGK